MISFNMQQGHMLGSQRHFFKSLGQALLVILGTEILLQRVETWQCTSILFHLSNRIKRFY